MCSTASLPQSLSHDITAPGPGKRRSSAGAVVPAHILGQLLSLKSPWSPPNHPAGDGAGSLLRAGKGQGCPMAFSDFPAQMDSMSSSRAEGENLPH